MLIEYSFNLQILLKHANKCIPRVLYFQNKISNWYHFKTKVLCAKVDADNLYLSPTMLVGLHTCGSLACNILRMFVESETATAVCVVGCCYQWMEEEFLQSPYYGIGGNLGV